MKKKKRKSNVGFFFRGNCWISGFVVVVVFQTLHDYDLLGVYQFIYTRFDVLDLALRSDVCHNHELQIPVLDFCLLFPLLLERFMIATYIKKIKHGMFCVSGVYLRKKNSAFLFAYFVCCCCCFPSFAHGCESSAFAPLLYLTTGIRLFFNASLLLFWFYNRNNWHSIMVCVSGSVRASWEPCNCRYVLRRVRVCVCVCVCVCVWLGGWLVGAGVCGATARAN